MHYSVVGCPKYFVSVKQNIRLVNIDDSPKPYLIGFAYPYLARLSLSGLGIQST